MASGLLFYRLDIGRHLFGRWRGGLRPFCAGHDATVGDHFAAALSFTVGNSILLHFFVVLG